jgi:hypothetical protein
MNRLNTIGVGLVGLFTTFMTGCADSVLFVTKTSIGIDFDTKPPSASIAYDRTEGYLGPRYDNGAVPPVYGRILSDAAIFNAKVRQIYATGPAAQRVLHTIAECDAQPQLCPSTEAKLEGGKRLMFFGTMTSTGLKVTFSPEYQYPDSFHLGYKRKEFSFIPVGTTMENGKPVDTYPAVLAAIDTQARATVENSNPSAGLMTGQFFATGAAAEQLAMKEYIHDFFKDESEDAFHAYRDTKAQQDNQAKRTLFCYMNLIDPDAMASAWNNANQHQLFWEANRLNQLQNLKATGSTEAEKAENLREASRLYAADIAIIDGSKLGRTEQLTEHRKHVCQLAKSQ